jgi:pyruvate/2-oxoacid:ferredoxin oxidoreductase alpha subunit
MRKQLMKGNEAIVKSAILAGCRAFYGYPITPASEITEAAAELMPLTGGVYVQAESEVAAINMLYGAASAGVRAMTALSCLASLPTSCAAGRDWETSGPSRVIITRW